MTDEQWASGSPTSKRGWPRWTPVGPRAAGVHDNDGMTTVPTRPRWRPGAGFLTYEFVFAALPASLVVWLLLPPVLGLLPGVWFFLGGAALLWLCAAAQAVLVWRVLRGPRVA